MRRQLAQSRPSNTSAASIVNDTRPWQVDLILVTNTSENNVAATIYHDANGTTYDESTAIVWAAQIKPNDTAYFEFNIPITNIDSNGNLAVKSGAASALTFTVYGTLQGDRV